MDLPDWLSFNLPSLDGLNMGAVGISLAFVLLEIYFMIDDPFGVGWSKIPIIIMILFPLLSLPLFYFIVNRMED